MRGGRGAKRKGAGFEREVVLALKELGAIKVPLSGAIKIDGFDHDISCVVRGVARKIEAKRRARAFSTIATMLANNYALAIRDDRSPTMIVMRLETFVELAREQNG